MAEQYSRWGRTRETQSLMMVYRGEGMGMEMPEDETNDTAGFATIGG